MGDAGEPACMTPDQCFDEMAVALGVRKDTGYIDILAMVKKLKKETEELKHKEYCLRQDAKGYSPSEVQEYREETEELKEENKKLKEENKKLKKETEELKADDKYQQRIISKYSEENDMWHRVTDELTEENKKLKEKNHRMERYIEDYEVKYCETCMAYKMDTEEHGNGGVWLNSKGCYICDDCYDDLPDEERCEH